MLRFSSPVVAVIVLTGLAQADVFNMPEGQTSLETVWVLDKNNPNDPTTGYGAVGYLYQMGKYEVTNAQYCQFLNAKAPASDPYALYNTDMGSSDSTYGGITRSASTPYTYTAKPGYENRPVTFVCWYDAIRFANWLENGQGSGDTENGTYRIDGGGPNSGTVTVPDVAERATWTAANSHWVLPSENEWYKAAYYQPAAKGGDVDGYWLYPTGTNAIPTAELPPGGSNSANFDNALPFPRLTNVGAYTGSDSYYGTLDQGGNVWEWNETQIPDDSSRGWCRAGRSTTAVRAPCGRPIAVTATRRASTALPGSAWQVSRPPNLPPSLCSASVLSACWPAGGTDAGPDTDGNRAIGAVVAVRMKAARAHSLHPEHQAMQGHRADQPRRGSFSRRGGHRSLDPCLSNRFEQRWQ
jgi:formylglycine-generating enzyme required for sulfatase activity